MSSRQPANSIPMADCVSSMASFNMMLSWHTPANWSLSQALRRAERCSFMPYYIGPDYSLLDHCFRYSTCQRVPSNSSRMVVNRRVPLTGPR